MNAFVSLFSSSARSFASRFFFFVFFSKLSRQRTKRVNQVPTNDVLARVRFQGPRLRMKKNTVGEGWEGGGEERNKKFLQFLIVSAAFNWKKSTASFPTPHPPTHPPPPERFSHYETLPFFFPPPLPHPFLCHGLLELFRLFRDVRWKRVKPRLESRSVVKRNKFK